MDASRASARTDGISRTHEVAATLRSRITQGELHAHMRLPSERALAAQLNVSRVTVVRALTRLRLEGLLVTRHGAGTFVAATDRLMDTVAARTPSPWPPAAGHPEAAIDLRWATTAGPVDLLRIAATAVEHGLPAALALDGTVADTGDDLTAALAGYLSTTGLPTRAAQLTLTPGAMAGLRLVLDTVGPPGRLAIAETPTYPGALRILLQDRRRLVGWPAGTTGWDPDRLAYLMRPPAAGVLYVQPDGHNPTGASMPPAIRQALGRATREAGWVTIADETMRPLNLSGETLPSLARYNDSVLTVSSMSKIAWGGLRLGWIRAPAAITRQLRLAAAIIGAGPGSLDQVVGAELLSSIAEIIQRRTRLLTENLQHLEGRLRALGRPGLTWQRPAGGITVWLDLAGRSSHEVVQECARLGVLLEPSSSYTVGGRDDRHLRIPFTASPAIIDHAVDALGQALDRTGRALQNAAPPQHQIGHPARGNR
jgi:DNA-binding transcriptional MocR family regulator